VDQQELEKISSDVEGYLNLQDDLIHFSEEKLQALADGMVAFAIRRAELGTIGGKDEQLRLEVEKWYLSVCKISLDAKQDWERGPIFQARLSKMNVQMAVGVDNANRMFEIIREQFNEKALHIQIQRRVVVNNPV
jgi:hypothetical protein